VTEIQPIDRTRVVRAPNRAVFNRQTVYAILDDGLLCYLSFVADGSPHIIPTLHWREGDSLYIHGLTASRAIHSSSDGSEVCVMVSHLDGLVLARSAFHHSVNYRSVAIYGSPAIVADDRKEAALRAMVERITPGRWAELRPVNDQELKAPTVLELPINEASAKVRTSAPIDDPEDMDWPVWAGNVPFEMVRGVPVPDSAMDPAIKLPEYLRTR